MITSYASCSLRLLKGRQYKQKTSPKKYNYHNRLLDCLNRAFAEQPGPDQLHCWQLSKIILKLTFCIRLSEISGNSVFEQTHSTMLLNIGQYWLCEFQTPRPRIWDLTGTSHFQYYNIIVAQNTDKQKHPNARFVLGAFRMQNFRSLQMNKSILPGNTTRIRHWIVLWKEGLAISN